MTNSREHVGLPSAGKECRRSEVAHRGTAVWEDRDGGESGARGGSGEEQRERPPDPAARGVCGEAADLDSADLEADACAPHPPGQNPSERTSEGRSLCHTSVPWLPRKKRGQAAAPPQPPACTVKYPPRPVSS